MRAGAQERRKTVQRNSRPPDRILGQKFREGADRDPVGSDI